MKSQRLTDAQMAALINVSPRTINAYVNGRRRPRWAVVVRIAEVTDNAVTAHDWAYALTKSAVKTAA